MPVSTTPVRLPLGTDAEGAVTPRSYAITLVGADTIDPIQGWSGANPLSERKRYTTGSGVNPQPLVIQLAQTAGIATEGGTQTRYWVAMTDPDGTGEAFAIQVPASSDPQDLLTLRAYMDIPAGSIPAQTLVDVTDAAATAITKAVEAFDSAAAALASEEAAAQSAIDAALSVGAKGDTGAQGPQGIAGAAGPAGPDGPNTVTAATTTTLAAGLLVSDGTNVARVDAAPGSVGAEPARTAATQADAETGAGTTILAWSAPMVRFGANGWWAGTAIKPGRLGGMTIVGGTSATDALTLVGTSGTGSGSTAALRIGVGANGATPAVEVYHNGRAAVFGDIVASGASKKLVQEASPGSSTNFVTLWSGAFVALFQFPANIKFGIQAATGQSDVGGTGYAMMTFGATRNTIFGDMSSGQADPGARLTVRGGGSTTGVTLQTQDVNGVVRLRSLDSGATSITGTLSVSGLVTASGGCILGPCTEATKPLHSNGLTTTVVDAAAGANIQCSIGGTWVNIG